MCEMFSNDVFIVTFEAEFDLVNAGWVRREKILYFYMILLKKANPGL